MAVSVAFASTSGFSWCTLVYDGARTAAGCAGERVASRILPSADIPTTLLTHTATIPNFATCIFASRILAYLAFLTRLCVQTWNCAVPPDQLRILEEGGESHIPYYVLGPYSEGASLDITCVATGGQYYELPISLFLITLTRLLSHYIRIYLYDRYYDDPQFTAPNFLVYPFTHSRLVLSLSFEQLLTATYRDSNDWSAGNILSELGSKSWLCLKIAKNRKKPQNNSIFYMLFFPIFSNF